MVDSSFDKNETDSFITETTISKEDFYSKLGISLSDNLEIKNESKSESNRVLYLEINGVPFKGRELQKQLGLRSNDYSFSEDDNSQSYNIGYYQGSHIPA